MGKTDWHRKSECVQEGKSKIALFKAQHITPRTYLTISHTLTLTQTHKQCSRLDMTAKGRKGTSQLHNPVSHLHKHTAFRSKRAFVCKFDHLIGLRLTVHVCWSEVLSNVSCNCSATAPSDDGNRRRQLAAAAAAASCEKRRQHVRNHFLLSGAKPTFILPPPTHLHNPFTLAK